jgi:hypothetical protein
MVADISAPDNTISGRHTLLSTAALQEIVLGMLAASGSQNALGNGPTVGLINFKGSSTDSGVLTIPVNLITDTGQTNPTPLAQATFVPQYLQVVVFDQTNWKWDSTPTTSATIVYDSTAAQFTVTWPPGSKLAAGDYRVSLLSPDGQPIVDQRMRSLQPLRFTQNFGLKADPNNGNNLIWAPISF